MRIVAVPLVGAVIQSSSNAKRSRTHHYGRQWDRRSYEFEDLSTGALRN